jgi:hypothetical protein
VLDCWHDLTPGRRIGAELVGDHSSRWAALLLQQTLQQALGGLGVAARLNDFVEHIAVLINRPPEPVLLARDRDHDLVEMPDVAAAWRLALEAASVGWPNFSAQRRTVSYETTMPRSSSISSTSRRLRGNRKYNHTAWAMIWGGKRWRL